MPSASAVGYRLPSTPPSAVVEHVVADLLAPVGRQTVHEERIGLGVVEQRRRHLVAVEGRPAVGFLALVPHRRPDIGNHQIRAGHGLDRGIDQGDVRRRHDPLVRCVTGGRRDPQLETEQPGGADVRMAHVVAVADEGHRGTGDGAPELDEGLHVREQLAGMETSRHAVDHRYPGRGGESFHPGMVEGADHHRVDHLREHPGGVLDGLASAELGVRRADEQRMAAQLMHAHLERDPGAGGAQLEDHGQRPAAQGLVALALPPHGLQCGSPPHDMREFVRREVGQGQEMPHDDA